jgi:hypothetical protein
MEAPELGTCPRIPVPVPVDFRVTLPLVVSVPLVNVNRPVMPRFVLVLLTVTPLLLLIVKLLTMPVPLMVWAALPAKTIVPPLIVPLLVNAVLVLFVMVTLPVNPKVKPLFTVR